ncbi:MAG: GGDEF domain-containing protein [Candidatus Acidiferrales bacterium]
MTPLESEPLQTPPPARAEEIKSSMRRIARRQWWLWSSAVLVTLLLTLGIASFAFPGLLNQAENSVSNDLDIAMRGLVGLVLIFNIYTIYQQLQIHRIQANLSKQVDALGRMEERTDEVYKMAVLDPLTGLYNRRSGEQRLAEEISRSHRHARPLTVLLLDLNGLKAINDTFGHPAGDQMIKHFAELLQKAIRGSDVAVRMGGDEFLVVLPECKPAEVHLVLDRLKGKKTDFDGHTIDLQFSAGWTNYIPAEAPEELLKRADAALYINKRAVKENTEVNTRVT